jgi:serine/threonine protein phosphatase 1
MGLAALRNRHARRAIASPRRIYAIGDMHGRLDLMLRIIALIEADTTARGRVPTRLIVLGDFIDRGPDAASVIAILMRLRADPHVIVLRGNHEAAMVAAIDGDHAALDLWIAHGGLATLKSFGADVDLVDPGDSRTLLRLAREVVPTKVVAWLRGLPTHVRFGGYYFVHAGVRPGVALRDQRDEDRLWIREAFTDSDADHGAIVVHGHTVCEDGPVVTNNRICVDTGAYRTGRLSAVGIDATSHWLLTTQANAVPANAQ